MEFINRKVKVFRTEYNDKVAYSIGASKKNASGEVDYAYKPVRFRKGVDLKNKTEIEIKEGWEDFTNYKTSEGKNKTVWYFFINKFEMASDMDAIKQVSDREIQPKEKTYMEQQSMDDDNLPFY